MPFGYTYKEIREMIRDVVLTTPMARDIVRKSGFRPGAGVRGIPRGGEKGWALAKKSDADYDVWWVPNGPYMRNWFTDPELEGLDQRVRTDVEFDAVGTNDDVGSPTQPAPVMAATWASINEPLRSGVNNQGQLGFIFNPWNVGPETDFKRWTEKATVHESFNEGNIFQLSSSATSTVGLADSWGLHHPQAVRFWRIQAYVQRSSSDAYLFGQVPSTLYLPGEEIKLQLDGGTGYYDSGWRVFPPNRTPQTAPEPTRLVLYEPTIRDPVIPFAELQCRLYEFPLFFDWMYGR